MNCPQTPSDVRQVPETQKMSPQSRSEVHARATQTLPVGPRTQLKPEGQGVEAQRVCSQRRVTGSHVWPSPQGFWVEHPGWQSV